MIISEQNNVIRAGGIRLRLIEESDAEFVVNLRTNDKLKRHISETSSSIDEQIKWINQYKKREVSQKEFYFVFEDDNYKRWGTIRLYDLNNNHFTLGSWLCSPGNQEGIAIKAHLLALAFGFQKLQYENCLIDVRKKNLPVVNYLKLFRPIPTHEDDLNYFFRLGKDAYRVHRNKIIKIFKLKLQVCLNTMTSEKHMPNII